MAQHLFSIENLRENYHWKEITIGHSDAKTYLLVGDTNLYIKMQRKGAIEPLFIEKKKLEWLQNKLPVPKVLYYGEEEDLEYIVISELKGADASSENHPHKEQLIMLLAKGLKQIHSLPIQDCPFNQTLEMKLKEAQKRMELHLVDEEDFDDIRKGKKAGDLYEELLKKRPLTEDLVFTHGDYCLPNIIIDGKRISGFIDLGRAGISDRYQDIALAVRSISYNIGEEYVSLFFQFYGLQEVDEEKFAYYQLLDEFF